MVMVMIIIKFLKMHFTSNKSLDAFYSFSHKSPNQTPNLRTLTKKKNVLIFI